MTISQVHSNFHTFVHANSLCLVFLHMYYPHKQIQLIFLGKYESPLNLKLLWLLLVSLLVSYSTWYLVYCHRVSKYI